MFKNLNLEALGVTGRQSEIIEVTLSYGFKGLDLDMVDFAREVQEQGLAKARRLIDSARLKIGSFAIVLDGEWDDKEFKRQLDVLKPQIELAQQMGCTRATTLIDPATDVRPYHENYELQRRRLAETGDFLGTHGIRLGVGFQAPVALRGKRAFPFVQTVDAFLLLFKSIGSKNVGLALDVWQWRLGGGTLDQIRSLADKVVTVGLADIVPDVTADTATDNDRRLPAETGVIDAAAVLQALNAVKYDGPVTPLPSRSQFAGQGRDKIVKAAGAALDAVWKAAGLSTRPGVPAGRF